MFDDRTLSGVSVFVAAAETGSYGRAAEIMGITRSGVSRAVSRLEERIGITLFDRSGRTLRLTERGRHFHEGVAPLLEQLEHLAGRSATRSEDIRGRLRVCCDAAFATYLLLPRIGPFLEQYPNLAVDILVRDRCPDLVAEGYDAALRFGEPDPRLVEKTLLFASRVLTCASPSVVARFGLPSSPDELAESYPCVRLLDDVTGRPHLWQFERTDGQGCRVAPNATLTVNDAPSIMAALNAGIGAARVLEFMATSSLETGELIELLPEWNHSRWPAYIWKREGAEVSPGLSRLIHYVSNLPCENHGVDATRSS